MRTPTAMPGAPGLSTLNLDPEAAARAYRDRVVGPYRDLLPPAAGRQLAFFTGGGTQVPSRIEGGFSFGQ